MTKKRLHAIDENDILYTKNNIPDVNRYEDIKCQNCNVTYENNNKFPLMYIVSRKNKKFVWWHIDPCSGRKHNL